MDKKDLELAVKYSSALLRLSSVGMIGKSEVRVHFFELFRPYFLHPA